MRLRDGLYRVDRQYLVGGFVVRNGEVAECAPILRNKIDYWMYHCERVEVTTVVHRMRDEYDVLIDRSTKWGNPFSMEYGTEAERGLVIALYKLWILRQPHLLAALPELRGKVLGCWCAPKLCHGSVLAKLTYTYVAPKMWIPRKVVRKC